MDPEENTGTVTEGGDVAPATNTNGQSQGSAHKVQRADRLILGYNQCINDVRKMARAKFGPGTTVCNSVYELLDELEEGRDDGKSADEIAKHARDSRSVTV
jgi:hypothetical protein